MFKQIFKIIWKQRRSNGWLFGELLVVIGVLWLLVDVFLVDVVVYNQPLGFDIENTFRLKKQMLNEGSVGYIPEEQQTTTEAEDLLRLADLIRQSPEVEAVSLSLSAVPYAFGAMYTTIDAIDGDTTGLSSRSFQMRKVTPEYFSVFRSKDKNGSLIASQINTDRSSMVISADMETEFFGTQSGKGRKVKRDEKEITVSAVSEPIRMSNYEISNPCFYDVLVGSDLEAFIAQHGASNVELCVRMKQIHTSADMNRFLESMGDRLTVNNLYVYGAKILTQQREEKVRGYEQRMKIKIAMMAFMLVNVFFGIIGTFWLRTQYRRGEIGLRVALGSSKRGLYGYVNWEGLCLLGITIPIILFLIANLAFVDLMETTRLSLSLWRFLCVTVFTYTLMGGMICLGVWFPARKAVNLPPAEALRYE